MHLKSLRLFELSKTLTNDSDLTATHEEQEHLRHCSECQHVVGLFARTFGRAGSLNERREEQMDLVSR